MSLRTIIVRIVAFPAVSFVLVAGALTAALPRPAEAQTFTLCASIDARVTVAPSCEPGLLGTSTGVNAGGGACTLNHSGAYECKGDPSIKNDLAGAAIKFEPNEASCSTDVVGSGTCYGALVGQLPACDCSVPAEAQTWGRPEFFDR